MPFRKILVSVLALTVAVQPVLAEEAYYFRQVYASPLRDGSGMPPGAEPNAVPGTGQLRVFAPQTARGRPNVPLALRVVAQNAQGPVTWSVSEGALPGGLSLGVDGVVSGTPSAPGESSFAVSGIDAKGNVGQTKTVTLAINPLPTVTAESARIAAGDGFALAPRSTGTYGSVAWSLSGTLPLGLRVDPATGVISGTTRQAGTFDGLVLTVTDADGAEGRSAPFSYEVTARIAVSGLRPSYPIRVGGAFAGVHPIATGNANPVSWSLASGTLPQGLSLDKATGAITGMPASPGKYGPIALEAKDAVTGDSVISPSFVVELAGPPTLSAESVYVTRTMGGVTVRPKAQNLLSAGRWILDDGSVPPGFEFSPETGALAGGYPKIGASLTRNLRIRVIDLFDGAQASTQPFTVDVRDRLVLAAAAAPVGTVGLPYDIPAPTAYNLVGKATWSASGLPAGLTLNPNTGAISGKPTMSGRTKLVYAVHDSDDGATFSSWETPIDVVILDPKEPVPLAVQPLQPHYLAVTGRAFTLAPVAQGLTGPSAWSASTLPDWAGFDSARGALTGVPALPGLTEGIVLHLTDSKTGESVASSPFTVRTRDPVTAAYPPAIAAVQGTPISVSPTVADAEGPAGFRLAAGTLPSGIGINPATGALTGTTFDAGEFAGLAVRVADRETNSNTQPFRITVAQSAWTATVAESASGAPGVPFTLQPSHAGFPSAPSWSLVEGKLPPTLTLNPATGAITGTPVTAGAYVGLRLQADDGKGHVARTKPFEIGVYDQRILAASLPATLDAYVGTPLKVSGKATNALPPVTWTSDATLPAWLSLAADGTLTGTPTAAGTVTVNLTAVDGTGRSAKAGPLAIAARESTLAAPSLSSLTAPFRERFTSQAVAVSGAAGTPTFALAEGTLPDGLAVSPSTGAVTGTATSVGVAEGLVIEVTDGSGTKRRTNVFSVTVPRPVLSAVGPSGTLAANVDTLLSVPAPTPKGAVGAVTWTAAGLPPWLKADAAGALTGTPTEPGTFGPVTLTARDAFDGASVSGASFTVEVAPALPKPGQNGQPAAASVTLANAVYKARVSTSFASGAPVVRNLGPLSAWSVSGTLPPGLRLDQATGQILGVPTAPAEASLVLTATDTAGKTASSPSFAISVAPQPTVSLQVPAVRAGAPFQARAAATGLTGSGSFSLSSTAPSWLKLNPQSGELSGRAGPAGSYPGIVLKVTDVDGSSAIATFAVTVSPGIAVTGLQPSYPGRIGKPIAPVTPGVDGAKGGVTWTASEGTPLISGLSLSPTTGTVSGSPASAGSVRITATDASDGAQAEGGFALALAQPLALTGNLSLRIHEGIPARTPAPGIVGQRGSSLTFALTGGSLPRSGSFVAQTGQVDLSNPVPGTTSGLVVTATDPLDRAEASTQPFTVEVVPTPYVDGMATAYTAQYGKPFEIATPTLRNAIGDVTWSIKGQLPTWAYQRPDGAVVGPSPDAFGSTQLTMVGTDATGVPGFSAPFDLKVISQPAVTLSTASAKTRVGIPVMVTASANGTAASETWSYLADGGTLPDGIGFDASGPRVGGTPTAPGWATFRLKVVDALGDASAESQPVRLDVSPPLSLAMSDGADPSYVTRINTFAKSGNPSPVGVVGALGYQLSPNAPAGMQAFPADGSALSGTPTLPFPRTTFTVTARDGFDGQTATTSFSLTALDVVRVTATSDVVLRAGADAATKSFLPQAQNATDPSKVTWSHAGGTLPPGITVSPQTGALVGTAGSVAATSEYPGLLIRAHDADGTSGTNATPFKVTVAPALGVSLATLSYDARYGIARATGPATVTGKVSANPTLAVVTKSGTAPTTQTPPAADGSFSFTPDVNTSATWTYVIRATDGDGATAESQPVTVTTTSNPQVAFDAPSRPVYATSYQVVTPRISNTSGALTISWNAAPPAWISAPHATTGAFTVQPSGVAAGSYGPYRLNVKDGTGQIGSATITLTVLANTLAVNAPAAGANLQWHVSSAYAYQATATGASGPVTWSRVAPGGTGNASGPANLTVSATGAIGLNQASTLASTGATLYAYDAASGQVLTRTFTAGVVPALGMTLPAATLTATEGVNVATVTGTPANVVGTGTWTIEGGPPGLVVSASGVVSGAPGPNTSAPGGRIYNALVRLTDAAGGNVTQPLAVTVNQPPVLSFAGVPDFTQDGLAATACRDVRLDNLGTGPAQGLALAVTGSAEFQLCTPVQAPACGSALSPGASCWTGVRLAGTTPGSKTGSLTATATNGQPGATPLNGNATGFVAAGSYLVGSGSGSFTLPRPGMTFRVLAVGGGASGGAPQGGRNGGSSGVLAGATVPNGPDSVSYSVGTGGLAAMAANSTPGGTTTVTIAGYGTVTAAGGTASAGGSGGGGAAGYNGGNGGSGGSNGAATFGFPGTGQGTAPFSALTSLAKLRTVSAGGGGGGYGGFCNSACYPAGGGGAGGVVIPQGSAGAQNGPGSTVPAAGNGGGASSTFRGTGGYGFGAGGGGATYNTNRYGYEEYSSYGGSGAGGAFYIEWDAQ